MFSTGSTLKWVGPGSTWQGPCAISIATTPSPPQVSHANPIAPSFVFSGKVLNPVTSVFGGFAPPYWCPNPEMSWAARDSSNSIIGQGVLNVICASTGLFEYVNSFEPLGVVKRLDLTLPVPLPPGYADGTAIMFVIDYYVPCPPISDSLLNLQELKNLMHDLWQDSRVDSVATKRVERGGYLVRDIATGAYSYIVSQINPQSDTQCSLQNAVAVPPGNELIASVHTHPFRHGEVSACATPTSTYDALIYGGPSGQDYARLANDVAFASTMQAPHIFQGAYVVDKDNVYRAPPGTSTTNFSSMVQKFPRASGLACDLFQG